MSPDSYVSFSLGQVDSMLDQVDVINESGELVFKGWVHEHGYWSYRHLVDAEIETLTPLIVWSEL